MSEKILYVDDDPRILQAYQRVCRKKFEMATALGGQEGLELLASDGPFAVIISDMRMPGMDGIQFLAKAREVAPESVRIMLTGNADMQTAVNAVNEGHIFRFLTKPCPNAVLIKSVEAGVQQHRLIIAERQLLEETLNGCITVMTDVLSLVNPEAFGRATRIRRFVRHIVSQLGLADAWQFEVAAMLSQIGCVTLPPDTIRKHFAGQEMTEEEQEIFASHPTVAGKLIHNIPRLENVAHIIARQQEPFHWSPSEDAPSRRDPVVVGGQILKVVLGLDQLLACGASPDEGLADLLAKPEEYDPAVVAALGELEIRPARSQTRAVTIEKLDIGALLDQDVRAKNGNLLVTRGQEVTYPMLTRLERWARGVGIEEPVRVLVPCSANEQAEECVSAAAPTPGG
jgi:response regulator RpfG family c-di-GMP phosphodiesterase